MNNKFVYTPGPTYVRENVRLERAKITTNPDIDVEFVEFYRSTCKKVGEIINTKNQVYILNGEGILGIVTVLSSLEITFPVIFLEPSKLLFPAFVSFKVMEIFLEPAFPVTLL